MAGPRGGDGLRSARSGGRPAAPSCCREFFGQGWMKLEKNERTPHIMKTTKHFNDVSEAGSASPGVPGRGGCGVGAASMTGYMPGPSRHQPLQPPPHRGCQGQPPGLGFSPCGVAEPGGARTAPVEPYRRPGLGVRGALLSAWLH